MCFVTAYEKRTLLTTKDHLQGIVTLCFFSSEKRITSNNFVEVILVLINKFRNKDHFNFAQSRVNINLNE